MMPAPSTAWPHCPGMYSMSSCISLDMGNVCSQILPGPVSDARKIPSPPKIMFLIPGAVVIWKEAPAGKGHSLAYAAHVRYGFYQLAGDRQQGFRTTSSLRNWRLLF